MKKVILFSLLFVFAMTGVFAEACDLDVSLINQDPYPAIPGDYVKIVFQVSGVDNPLCGDVEFELLEQYPLIFDAGQQRVYNIEAGTFQRDYESFFLASYKVRVDETALDGENPMELRYKYNFGGSTSDETKQIDLIIDDIRANFEVYVKDYDFVTKTITFEILNIADVDVEALTVEIPKQENIIVKGANRNIEGDLDSNDYLTTSFEAIPNSGEIKLKIFYSDSINERRIIEKTVLYEPEYFEGRVGDETGSSLGTWIVVLLIIAGIGYWIYKKKKNKKLAQKRR